MKLLVRLLFLMVFVFLSNHPLSAQFFVDENTPCPRGNDVKVDTITFASNTSMPFDRCFYLRFTLKGKPNIKFFAINPIGRDGKLKIRRRDYRVFLKSSFESTRDRKLAREGESFKEFKIKPLNRHFEGIIINPKGNNTEVILNVPPLDPNREYQIILIGEDQTSVGELFTIGDLIFKSEAITTPQTDATKMRSEAIKRYESNINSRSKRFPPFPTQSFEKFKNYFASFSFEFSSDTITKELRKRPRVKAEEYRIFFSPENAPDLTKDQVLDLDHDKYWEDFYNEMKADTDYGKYLEQEFIEQKKKYSLEDYRLHLLKSKKKKEKDFQNFIKEKHGLNFIPHYFFSKPNSNPEKINISLPVRDTNKNIVKPYKDSTYKMTLVTIFHKYPYEKIKHDPYDIKIDTLKRHIIKITKLGVIKIPQNGIHYEFIPDPTSLSEDLTVKLSPLKSFEEIKESNLALEGIAHVHPSCFSTATLNFLMEKALIFPGVEKGIKDLTLKDDLTRTLSILFEQKNEIIQNIKLGIVSLKDPSTKTESSNFSSRKSNVEASINQIIALEEFAREVLAANSLVNSGNVYDLLTCLKDFREELSNVVVKLKANIEQENKVKGSIAQQFALFEVVPASSFSSTSLLEFVNEAKFRIVPDFGFITTFKGDNSANLRDFTPYIGVHVNFRPIDKAIKPRFIRYKSLWYRLSFITGISLSPLKIENRREDLFDKTSLITGLGFRLNNYVKITSGTAWFKSFDPNLLTNDKPLRFSPFVGISIDFDLQQIVPDVKKLFSL